MSEVDPYSQDIGSPSSYVPQDPRNNRPAGWGRDRSGGLADDLGGGGSARPGFEQLIRAGQEAAAGDLAPGIDAGRRKKRGTVVIAPPPVVRESLKPGPEMKLRVVALDPGRTRDRFGVAVLEWWDPVALVMFAGVLPKAIDQPTQLGFVLDFLTRMEQVDYVIVDGRGVGIGMVDSLRAAVDPKFARRVLDLQVGGTGGQRFSRTLRKTRGDGGCYQWSLPKGELVERTEADIVHGRLALSSRLPDEQRAALEKQVGRYSVTETEAGGARYSGGSGAGVDDLVFAVMAANLVVSDKRGNRPSRLITPPAGDLHEIRSGLRTGSAYLD